MTNLEANLINPDLWPTFYEFMPEECKAIVDGPKDVVGIGIDKKHGWYILFGGQGPGYLTWTEKKNAASFMLEEDIE